MSRSFFRSTPTNEQNAPLLPLQHLPPHVSRSSPSTSSYSRSRSPRISPSPPPSFYRAQNAAGGIGPNAAASSSNSQTSPSRHTPSRTRTIQFAPPPPSIMASTFLSSPQQTGMKSPSRTSTSTSTRTSTTPTIRRAATTSATADPLLILERRERAIQLDLQGLLDAQSAGLVQGFGGGGGGGAVGGGEADSEAGSSTPTMSVRSGDGGGRNGYTSTYKDGHGQKERYGHQGVVPVRQPRRKVVGLRGARRGLGRDMGALIEVKIEEENVLDAEMRRRGEVLGRVEAWEQQIAEARRKIGGFNQQGEGEGEGEEDSEVLNLKEEQTAVENEIRELEERLTQMRARKKWLGERILEGENRKEARLSSYRGVLREVENEVRDFLKAPPLQISVVMGEDRGFFGLPIHRRTLGMAREWWRKEISQLEMRKREVEDEKIALEKGKKMWADSVEIVTEFEDGLRQQMASDDPQSPDGLRIQISKMREVIDKLGVSFKLAEEKGWNLLICAVGAELEAFKEGEEILKSALEMVASQDLRKDGNKDVEAEAEVEREDSFHSTDDGLSTLAELNGALKSQDSESEDDGPNLAELLVDRNTDD